MQLGPDQSVARARADPQCHLCHVGPHIRGRRLRWWLLVRLGTAGRVALAVGTDGDGFRFQRYREGLSDALAEAFKLTGVEKGEFEVTKWGRDAYGKSSLWSGGRKEARRCLSTSDTRGTDQACRMLVTRRLGNREAVEQCEATF
jgi:hypothetical protein